MKIIEKNIHDIKEYEKNPRKNEKAVEFVANSIKEFGFKNPIIIDKNNIIVAGHTRLKAAKKLNIDKVPCIIANDLTEEQIKAFRLADNKVSEVAEWNKNMLDDELKSIFEIDMTQFNFDLFVAEEEQEEAEIEFTEILGEEHNYIVLYFDNEVDWLQAQSLFDVREKKNLSTRKDGEITKKMTRKSLGRVLKGKEALEELRGYYENIN